MNRTNQKIIPTNERLSKGDVGFNNRIGYQSLTPTTIEAWRETGWLGTGKKAEDRFSACEVLFELAERTELMASNTVDLSAVRGKILSYENDVTALDHVRFIMKKLKPESRKIFSDILIAPKYRNESLTQFEVKAATDNLAQVVEEWRETYPF